MSLKFDKFLSNRKNLYWPTTLASPAGANDGNGSDFDFKNMQRFIWSDTNSEKAKAKPINYEKNAYFFNGTHLKSEDRRTFSQ